MSESSFQFKEFTVFHDKCAMKVGTDGVLLGAWTECDNCKDMLDIGTGCGLIALMLAQKSAAFIDAIEIDNTAAIQAADNFKNSKWSNRLTIIHKSLQVHANSTSKKYDLIVSNPPFFENSLKTPLASRNIARHNEHLLTKIFSNFHPNYLKILDIYTLLFQQMLSLKSI